MNESLLLRLALAMSVLGLIVLFFLSRQIEINDTTIEKITNEEITGKVSLNGKIKEISSTEGATFIKLVQENEIDVVVFDKVVLAPGDEVQIIGRADEESIIADKIVLS